MRFSGWRSAGLLMVSVFMVQLDHTTVYAQRDLGVPFGIQYWPNIYKHFKTGFFRLQKDSDVLSGYDKYPSYKASNQVVSRDANCQNNWDGTVHLVDESTRFKLMPRLGNPSRTQQCLWVFRTLRPNMLIRFHCHKINIGPPSTKENKNICRIGREGTNHIRFTDPRLSEVMCQDVTWAEYVTRAGFLNITLKVYGSMNIRPDMDCQVTGTGPCNCGIENTEPFQPVLHKNPNIRYAAYTFRGKREAQDVSLRSTPFSEYIEENKITPAVYEHHNDNNDQEENEHGARVKRNTMKSHDSRSTYRFPWTALVIKDGYLCTASILSEYWLLTTGICAMQVPHGIRFKVKTNNNKYYRGYQGIPHEEFDMDKFNDNLGMIQMAEKIKFFDFTVLPICPQLTHYDRAGYKAYITTFPYGRDVFSQSVTKGKMMYGSQCGRKYQYKGDRVTPNQDCIEVDSEVFQCGRDDGSPVMKYDEKTNRTHIIGVLIRDQKYCQRNKDVLTKHVFTHLGRPGQSRQRRRRHFEAMVLLKQGKGKKDSEMDSTQTEEEKKVKRKKIMKKLDKIRLQRSTSHCRFSPGNDVRAVFEMKIKKLKKNNRELAKALSDQKIETNQWYSETVRLKAELQETQEKLLSYADDNFNNIVMREVQKQLMEFGQPLNAALSSAIENVVKGVDSLTKAKQVASSFSNGTNRTSWSSSMSISLPRTSGSRLPLAPGSSNSSPQRAVLPMVSGHVLQQVCVPIQKLNIAWQNKITERSQDTEDRNMELSIIGEQSSMTPVSEVESSITQDSLADTDEASSFMGDVINDFSPQSEGQRSSTTKSGQLRKSVRRGLRRSCRSVSRAGIATGDNSPPCPPTPSAHFEPSHNMSSLALNVSSSSPSHTHASTLPVLHKPLVLRSPAIVPQLPNSPPVLSVSPDFPLHMPSPAVPSYSVASPPLPPAQPQSSSLSAYHTDNSSSPKNQDSLDLLSLTLSQASSPSAPPSKALVNEGSPKRTSLNQQTIQDEDPLEGPSWLYSNKHQGRGQGRPKTSSQSRGGRGRGRGRGNYSPNNSPTWHLSVVNVADLSNDSDEDSSRISKISGKKRVKGKSIEKEARNSNSPARELDRSYLSSPATMLARLEDLEAKGGRRSRTRSKGRSLRASEHPTGRKAKSLQGIKIRKDEFDNSQTLKVGNRKERKKTSLLSTELSPVSIPKKDKYADYLITDKDLTLIHNCSMDMTQPVAHQVIASAEEVKEPGGIYDPVKLESHENNTQVEKKFFKGQQANTPQITEATNTKVRTPFDLSLLDASVMPVQSYSSKRVTEKENQPPHVNKNSYGRESPGLKRVSVVLEDCMKAITQVESESAKVNKAGSSTKSLKASGSVSKRGHRRKSSSGSPAVKKSVKSRTLTFVTNSESSDEDSATDMLYKPPYWSRKKKSTKSKKRSESLRKSQSRISGKKGSSEDKNPEEPKKKTGRKVAFKVAEKNATAIDDDILCSMSPGISDDEQKQQKVIIKGCYVKISPTNTPQKCDVSSLSENRSTSGVQIEISEESHQPVNQKNQEMESADDENNEASNPVTTSEDITANGSSSPTETDIPLENVKDKQKEENPCEEGKIPENLAVVDKMNEYLVRRPEEDAVKAPADDLGEEMLSQNLMNSEQYDGEDIMSKKQETEERMKNKQRDTEKETKDIEQDTEERLRDKQQDADADIEDDKEGTIEDGRENKQEDREERIDMCMKKLEEKGTKGENVCAVNEGSEGDTEKPVETLKRKIIATCYEENTMQMNLERNLQEKGEEQCEGQRRKRRAASKVTSFKEMSLNRKMRKGKDNTVVLSSPQKTQKKNDHLSCNN
ncbi:hypothetical protein Pmani_013744 [Petrolisthes manimaculis]|uniref:Peptidase S1 domain-containing protein n=1 Tax=Petrolisthes manimaculis TaxID=1843537 RepID=A0AAE1U924_9EUCA|nr:hypothetical protein Pmani_013744 [Petrolisthes manimaculis]